MTEQVDKRLALRKLATGLKRMAAEQPGNRTQADGASNPVGSSATISKISCAWL